MGTGKGARSENQVRARDMLTRQRGRPRQGSTLSINSSVAAAHDAQSPYSGPPFSPLSGKTPRDHDDWSTVDADDLFVRFTVAEAKNIQFKLRYVCDWLHV